MGFDLLGLIELVLIVWGLIAVMQSGASTGEKLIWVLIIILVPILGFVIWYFIGPGTKAFPLKR